MSNLFRLLRKSIRDSGVHLVYKYVPEIQGTGRPHEHVREFTTYSKIPKGFRLAALSKPYFNVMVYRLLRGQAKFFSYSENGSTLQAYGWIQSGSAFRHKLGMLADDGILLGPYWTEPEHRGKRIYGALIRHCLFVIPKDKPTYIYTSPTNISSQRGILDAGFQATGTYRVTHWFWFFRSSETLSA